MKFRIQSIRQKDQKILNHVYDNINNQIETDEGIPVCLSFDPRFDGLVKKPGFNKVISNISQALKLDRLDVKLGGSKVDFHLLASSILSKVAELREVRFWLGATVGKEDFKSFVSVLRQRFQESSFVFVVEAQNLTKDILDLCLALNLNLTIRIGSDEDEKVIFSNSQCSDIVQKFLRKNHSERKPVEVRLQVVVTPKLSQLSQLFQITKANFKEDIPVDIERIVSYDKQTIKFGPGFDEERANQLLNEMFVVGISLNNATHIHGIYEAADLLYQRLLDEQDIDHISRFGFSEIEMDGVGTVLTPLNAKVEVNHLRFACQCCPFVVSCFGGNEGLDDEDHEIGCRTLSLWHLGLFMIAWFRIFGAMIQTIEPIQPEIER